MAKVKARQPEMHAIGAKFGIEDRDGDGIPDVTLNEWLVGTCRFPDTDGTPGATSATCCEVGEWHPDYDRALTGTNQIFRKCAIHAVVPDATPEALHHALHDEDDYVRECFRWGATNRLFARGRWVEGIALTFDGTARAANGITRKLVVLVADTLPISEAQAEAQTALLAIKFGPGRAEVRRVTL